MPPNAACPLTFSACAGRVTAVRNAPDLQTDLTRQAVTCPDRQSRQTLDNNRLLLYNIVIRTGE